MIGFLARWLFRALLLVLILWTVVFVLVAFALNTESGTRWVIARVDAALPGNLEMSEFAGTLWQGLHIESLDYVDDAQRIELRDLDFDLHWPTVVTGRLAFDSLDVRSARRDALQPRANPPEPFSIEMQPLPVALGVRDLSIASLELRQDDQQQQFSRISARQLRIDGRRFVAEQVNLQRDNLQLTVQSFAMRLAGKVETSGDLTWRLVGSDWSGEGPASGDLAALNVQQQINGPYPLSVAGQLHVLGRYEPEFNVQLGWDRWGIGGTVVADGRLDVVGTLRELVGNYRAVIESNGISLMLSGVAAGNLDALSSFTAKLENDQLEVDVTGSMTRMPEFSADATAVASFIDPQLLHSQLQGRLRATADLSVDANGSLTAQQLDVSGEVNDTQLRGRGDAVVAATVWRCSDCTLDVGRNKISLSGEQNQGQLTATLELAAPALAELWPGLVGSATGAAEITGDRGDLALDWEYEDLAVSATAALQYRDEQLIGTVQSAAVSKPGLGSWVLQNPFTATYADQDFSASRNDWLGEQGNVRISKLDVGSDGVQIVADATDIPLQSGNAFLPSNYRLAGWASASVDLYRQNDLWNGTANWVQHDTSLQVVDVNGDVSNITVPRAKVEAVLIDSRLNASGGIEVDPGVSGDLQLSLESLQPDTPMTASLQLSGEDWSWVSALVPQIDRFAGAISADILAAGPLNAPRFSGTAEWQDGGVSIPSLNIQLSDVGVVVTGAAEGAATVTGSARSGSGTLQIEGRLEDLMEPTRRASLQITGKGAELVNWPEYRVWGSPEISLTGDPGDWRITGQLVVPRAKITPREAPVSAVTISPDVVVLGEEGVATRPTRITGETRLVLGDDVEFSALGLETRLRGNILFKQVEGRPISAEGRLTLVDGTYATQGRKLAIEQGELVFTGPLDDPLVDVRAVRVIEDFAGTVKAGIHLRGRAQSLTTTVFSEPTMSDADALSYLVLGRPLSQASDTDGGELSGAAVALGLRQMSTITAQIGQSLGVDELSLAGDGGDTTALVAGKQVNERLYARYAYGVFSELGTLLLRYRLNRNVTLEAGAGEHQSLDVLYTIEK